MATITKCLFPVAGYGTGFLPITKSMPKELLSVVNKPPLQVKDFVAATDYCFEHGPDEHH